MNVVLYLRYSSNKQGEQSIEGQDRVCSSYCEHQGYTIVGRYIDRATSASKDTDKRLEFQKMIRDSEKQQFDAVVVYKLDRFARNRYDSATFKAKLKKNGVSVLSATEALSDSPESIILESVLEGMAEFYSKELAQKVNRGMHETALKGNFTGGNIPLGYKVENHKLVIDPLTAPAVQEAFRSYVAGESITSICKRLNAQGYRTTKGALFNKCSFYGIFKNKRYIGTYTYKDVEIENGIPALIDTKTFAEAQQRILTSKHTTRRGSGRVNYLLSGKVFCGVCGASMVGVSGVGSHGATYNYYSCVNNRKHQCSKKPVKKDWLEKLVIAETKKLLTPEVIDKLGDMVVKACDDEMRNGTELPALEAQLDAVCKNIDNLYNLAMNGLSDANMAKRINEKAQERDALIYRIDTLKANYITLEKDMVVWWLEGFTQGDINNPDFCRRLVDLLVNSVTVFDDDRVKIVYNLREGNEKLFSQDLEESSTVGNGGSPLERMSNFSVFGLAGVFVITV